MPTYASSTDVSSERSRGEIERTLAKYGARSFGYGWDENKALIAFTLHGRQMRFVLPLPDRNDKRFTHTEARRQRRSATAAAAAYDQAVRSSWRALQIVIKAKLVAVEAGVVTFEQEFGMHMVLPDGRTVAEHTLPAIEHAYATNQVPPMLAIGPAK